MQFNGYVPQVKFVEDNRPDLNIIGLEKGEFVLKGQIIWLQMHGNRKYDLADVSIISTAFNELDGVLRWPQPTLVNELGIIQKQGDIVLIGFRKSNPNNPIVLGSIIPLKINDFFHAFEYDSFQQRKARFETDQAIIEFQDDGKGEIKLDITGNQVQAQAGSEAVNGTGNITVNLTGFNEDEENGTNGSITINANGLLTLTFQKDITITTSKTMNVNATEAITVKSEASVLVDSPEIVLGLDATEKLVLGDTFATLFKTHTHPTGTGPSGPPTEAAQMDSCLSAQNTTL